MKKYKLITLLLLLLSISSFAQPGSRFKEKKEQVKSLKVAFITNKLDLTPEESAKFWPLYNAFEDKQHEIRKQRLKVYMDRVNNSDDKLSEKDATTLLNQMESTEEELHQLKKKFITNLKSVLPATKILKLNMEENAI